VNWPAYNKALKCRGSLTAGFDPDMTFGGEADRQAGATAHLQRRCRQTWLKIKVLFGRALRQIGPWERHWSE